MYVFIFGYGPGDISLISHFFFSILEYVSIGFNNLAFYFYVPFLCNLLYVTKFDFLQFPSNHSLKHFRFFSIRHS
jgi:hypothetical protein